MTDTYDIDWRDERDRLATAARTDAEWNETVARRLCRASDRLALDVGCGGAGMALALARTLPEAAGVLALDGDESILETARSSMTAAGVPAGRVEFRQCDLHDGLDGLRRVVPAPADVVWASAVVHHVGDQQGAVNDLAALLAGGGRLALAEGGIGSRYLPWDVGVGEPGLELRLAAAEDVWFSRMRARLPGSVQMPYGWTDALRRAGLNDIAMWSFLIEQPAPLTDGDRADVIAGLRHRIDRIRDTGLLTEPDLAAWEQLLAAGGAALADRTDLYRLSVRIVHVGTSP
jgi:SAM-dependent methyltransferase